jgi:tryptophan synthase alpha chain
LAKEIKKEHNIPILVMTYYNPVFRIGLEKFFSLAKSSGVDGLIVPDLPVEEAEEYKRVAVKNGLDTVFLAAPSTTDNRLSKIVSYSSGFLYLVSHFGVTGARTKVEDSTTTLVKRVCKFTAGLVPLAVGFGVSKPEHVKDLLAAGAEGVIVGSLFVNIINKNFNDPERMLKELEETARRLKSATIH